MTDRRVHVVLCSLGRTIELDGLAASVVALAATTSLSPRTLGLLCQLAAHETTLAAITRGAIEVDLTESGTRIYRRTRLPRVPIGLAGEEDIDAA